MVLPPLPLPNFSPLRPTPGESSMSPTDLGPRAAEPGVTPNAKRQSGAARTLVVAPSNDQ